MTTPSATIAHDSPIGRLLLHAHGDVLVGLDIVSHQDRPHTNHISHDTDNDVLQATRQQLDEYFAGSRQSFDIPHQAFGTEFQKKVWQGLGAIPFGTTLTYQQLGEMAGVGRAPRAVGGAVGKNPIAIIIPCHRVLGASGAITGYSGGDGIITKEHLLRLENIPYSTTKKTSSG